MIQLNLKHASLSCEEWKSFRTYVQYKCSLYELIQLSKPHFVYCVTRTVVAVGSRNSLKNRNNRVVTLDVARLMGVPICRHHPVVQQLSQRCSARAVPKVSAIC